MGFEAHEAHLYTLIKFSVVEPMPKLMKKLFIMKIFLSKEKYHNELEIFFVLRFARFETAFQLTVNILSNSLRFFKNVI